MLDFKKIKYYYDNKLWTKEMVKNSVKMNKIIEVQYKEITNENYVS